MMTDIKQINEHKLMVKRKKKNIINKVNHILYSNKKKIQINFTILLLFIIIFPDTLSKQVKFKTLIFSYEITIKIQGTGYQIILNDDIETPYQIIIGGQTLNGTKALSLDNSPTTIKLIWNSALTTCKQMFFCISNILEIDFSYFDSSKVTTMDQMFFRCSGLTSINFSNMKTSLVTDMHQMFAGCYSLKSLDLSSFDTSSVTRMYQMFHSCISLETVDLSHFNTKSLDNMEGLFGNCNSLKSLDLSSFNTSSIISLSEVFKDCHTLTSLNLSNFDTKNIQSFVSVFGGCSGLEILDISNFDTSAAYNFGHMFDGCRNLKSINIRNFDSSHVLYLDYMFNDCNLLEYLDLSNFDTSSAQVSHHMFQNCYNLKSLDVSNFVTSKVTDMNNMFSNCYSLTSLELGNFDTSLVTDMSNMFYNCYLLTSLNLNSFSVSKLNSFENMFFNLTDLKYCINEEANEIKTLLSSFIKLNCSELCSKDSSNKFIKEKNKCISNCTLDNTYILEYNNICYQLCPKRTHLIYNYYCEDDLICNNYYNYNHTACLDEIPLGYYLNDTINRTIDKCPIKCSNCTNVSVSKELCDSCNNNENYYSKLNDDINENIYIDCYIGEQIGYYLDNKTKVYRPCYSKCKKCSGEGNDENHKCTECINSDYLLDNDGNCKEIPEIETTIIIQISETISNNDNNELNITFNYNLTDSDLEKIKYCNGRFYSYNINSNITELKNKNKNITFIDILENNYDYLYEKFHLNKESDNIYIVIIDYLCKDNRTATSNYIFKFFLENNTELNLSKIDEDIYFDFYVPIKELELANFNHSLYFATQGYDIYNKSSNFYNDVCSPAHVEENDITLNDRKKYIFPNNVTLCKDNCEYNGVDLENEIIICSCNLNSDSNQEIDEDNFLIDEGNFITYFLDKINYNIFKCYELLSSFDNLKNNYAFYSILGFFAIIISLNFIYIFFSLPKIRYSMLKRVISKENSLKYMRKKIKRKITANNPPIKFKEQNQKKINKKNSKKKMKIITTVSRKYKETKTIFTKIKKNSNSPFQNLIHKEKIVNNNEEINDLPYTKAINMDKRNIFEMFYSVIIQKIEIIYLFCGNEKIKIMMVSEYILYFLFNFFFNAFLYSDEVVSNKYHNNGKLDIFVTFVLTIGSNIITSIFCYYINYSKGIEERSEFINEIRIEFHYLRNVNRFIKYLKIKFIFFLIGEIILLLGCYYYIVIFCILYSKSKASLVINYILSLVEGVITSISISIIIIVTRKIGLLYHNKSLYNASKFINNRF